MSPRLRKHVPGCLAVLCLTGLRAAAQHRYVQEEPRWLTMRLNQAACGVFAEGFQQKTESGGASSTQTRMFLGPLIGLGLSGSVYHPNLLAYRINLDGSVGYTTEKFSGAASRSDSQLRYLGSFNGYAHILDSKPLNGRVFGGYSQTYQDYDFFNRTYVDSWRYGAGAHYTTGPFSLQSTAYRDIQDSTGYGTPTKSDSTTVSADAGYTRKSGSTALGGSLTSYTRNDYGVSGDGQDYTLSASDSEDFGSRKQFRSLITLGMNHVDNSSVPGDIYTALGHLRVEHTERLLSQYGINYSRNSFGGANTDNLNGNANLQHRLFDSLTSELNLQGYRYSATSGGQGQDSWQFGGGPALRYVKKLSASTTFSAYETLMLLHTDIQSTGGVIPVFDEQHTFGSGGIGVPPKTIVLRQPHVIVSTIVVTDTSHLPVGGYRPELGHYIVRQNGDLTFIERPDGSPMPNTVLVSYNFDSSPSGAYDTLNNSLGVRFDFFNNHWAVYARFNLNENSGDADVPVNNLNDFVFGTEVTWRFLRAGAEAEIYDSSMSPFNALRLFQTFTFYPGGRSTLSLNLNESFLDYETASRTEQNYSAVLRYSQPLTRRWAFSMDLGASQRIGEGADQTLAVVRPQFQYTAGSLSGTIGYDYGYDEYLKSQTRVRNMGFVRIRKEF